MVGWVGLFDYSVKPGPDLSRFRLGLFRLVTRSAKAKFGQDGDQVRKVKQCFQVALYLRKNSVYRVF